MKNLSEVYQKVLVRKKELERILSDPSIYNQKERFREARQEHAHLTKITESYQQYSGLHKELKKSRQLLEESEGELRELAQHDIAQLEKRMTESERALRLLLTPPDPRDAKNCIAEIRAGSGGEEASLFVADLYRMYSRYAERHHWKIELLSSSPTEVGGFREIIFSLSGTEVFSMLKYESGVHRVQRVPLTESQGRIHTSAVSVAVLPEADETEIEIQPEDLRVDVYRSSGPGGQSVNTTDSAVRITHIPSGVVVICQDEKSQHKNRAKALRVLRARLLEEEERKQQMERATERRNQIGSGDRSERIRTYNFAQNRVTDHRVSLTLYSLNQILDGELQEIIDTLRLADAEQLPTTLIS